MIDHKLKVPDICQNRINFYLTDYLHDNPANNPTLQKALEYTLLAPGKRIRSCLAYATAELVGCQDNVLVDQIAASIEMIHTYSLIHDDLPAMDDDDLRRGKPSCHKKFNEAMAILAGDALQTMAFEILCHPGQTCTASADPGSHRLKLIKILASAAGKNGMIAGQAIDIQAENKQLSLDKLNNMHNLKTGALIKAAINMAAILSPQITPEQLYCLDKFGEKLGLAFQIQDDILDVTQTSEILGKPQGSDAIRNLSTYPQLLGLDKAIIMAEQLKHQAIECLKVFDCEECSLLDIAEYILKRKN